MYAMSSNTKIANKPKVKPSKNEKIPAVDFFSERPEYNPVIINKSTIANTIDL